jgi:VWFA-related protein
MYRPAVIALLAAPALAQGQPPVSFPSAVELIIVDAVVVGDDGRPVAGLTRDDFVVKEDGKLQEVVSFESFAVEDGPAAPSPAPASAVASNQAPEVRSARAFVILLDDLGLAMRDAEETRRAVSAFLRRSLREGDEVVLGTTSGEYWWKARMPEGREDALAVVARLRGRFTEPAFSFDRMTDYEAFAINQISSRNLVFDRVRARWAAANLCREPMCEQMVRSRAVDLDGARRNRLKATLHALRRAVEALAPIRGRKSLMFFSRGFVEDPEAGLRDVAASAQRANAAVYFIDARGLQAMPGTMSASEGGPPPDPRQMGAMLFEENLESGGAQALALETGGLTVRNTNDLAAGAERVAGESRVYYLLGFHPPPGKAAAQWRKLSVEVKGKGLKVRARRGYALGGPAAEPGRGVARALDSPRNDAGIPLRAMVYVLDPRAKGLTRVLVAAEFEASRLALPAKGKSRSGASS